MTDADVDARLREAATRGLRCDVTGNLCGTDTWTVDWPCHCPNCARYLSHLVVELRQENERREALLREWVEHADCGCVRFAPDEDLSTRTREALP